MPPTAIALLAAATLYVLGTLLSRRLRDWHAADWMHLVIDSLDDRELPAQDVQGLSAQARRLIRDHAEETAALAAASGARVGRNPHTAGTRAHVLWETSFHARLIYLTERRSVRGGVELAENIARLRASRH